MLCFLYRRMITGWCFSFSGDNALELGSLEELILLFLFNVSISRRDYIITQFRLLRSVLGEFSV